MLRPSMALLGSFALVSSASAQLIDHTFDRGNNPDGWVAWDSQFSSVVATGGQPLEQLILNNLGAAPTCQFVFVEPTGPGPYQHTGDWRAAGVERVSVDLNTRAGSYGGIWCVFLASDPGTPNDISDDCYLILIHPDGAPLAPGWNRYVFDLPTQQTTAAPGWFAGGACEFDDLDTVWNNVLTGVDRMFFVLDAAPGQGCISTNWSLGIDNISVQADDIGSVYCAGVPNSTGARGEIATTGSNVIAANDVTFEVTNLPTFSFGYFLMSRTSARASVASGDLCLGGTIVRYSLSVQQAQQDGRITFSPDLTNLPQGNVFLPGESWNFQYWHRDTGATGPSANFSEATQLRFL